MASALDCAQEKERGIRPEMESRPVRARRDIIGIHYYASQPHGVCESRDMVVVSPARSQKKPKLFDSNDVTLICRRIYRYEYIAPS
jgi:hypothetical protein